MGKLLRARPRSGPDSSLELEPQEGGGFGPDRPPTAEEIAFRETYVDSDEEDPDVKGGESSDMESDREFNLEEHKVKPKADGRKAPLHTYRPEPLNRNTFETQLGVVGFFETTYCVQPQDVSPRIELLRKVNDSKGSQRPRSHSESEVTKTNDNLDDSPRVSGRRF